MSSESANSITPTQSHPICRLSKDDLDLATELVLRGGSFKDLAATYGVSYPTIRTRVDRLIERLRAIVENKPSDPLTDLLAGLVERGEMSAATARLVRDAARDLAQSSGRAASTDTPPTPSSAPEQSTEPAPARRFDWKPRYS